MKMLVVNTGWQTQSQLIGDNAMADAAYEIIKVAMGTYDKYGNDKTKTISIDTGSGGNATYRLETLVAVSIEDCEQGEQAAIDWNVWRKRLESKVAARLAPAES